MPLASKELLNGCAECGSKFFFYIRDEQLENLRKNNSLIDLSEKEKKEIEKEVRDIVGINEYPNSPVILDFESIRITGSGKFEIDLAKVFNKNRPLVYKLEEGKYIIDLGMTFNSNIKENEKK